MAARTTTGTGTVSNSDGSVLNGGTPLGVTDTLTISHSVTLTGECGSSPSTGGTAAVTIASNSITVTIPAAGFTAKGDIRFANDATGVAVANVLKLQSGATLTFKPPSGQQYGFVFESNTSFIDCEGAANPGDVAGEAPSTTGGNHCTIKTDKSLSGLAAFTGTLDFRYNGFRTVSYTDFIDMGTATQFGVQNYFDGSAATDVSHTYCSFTRSNYRSDISNSPNWPSTYTFQGNTFASSVLISGASGYGNVCAAFAVSSSAASGTWLITKNGFDSYIEIPRFPSRVTFSRNVAKRVHTISGPWLAANFTDNIITDCIDQNLYGPIQRCYLSNTTTNNPHWLSSQASGTSVTDCVIDPTDGVLGNGDILMMATAAGGTTSVTGNLSLSRSNKAAGVLVNGGLGVTSGSITVEHNTMLGQSDMGLVSTNETANSFAGEFASVQSNLIYSTAAADYVLAIHGWGSGTTAVDAVTLADYNAFRNPSSNGIGTTKYNTSTVQASVVGYNGIVVSNANPFPNAQVGLHDLTITSDPFVDSTRCLKKWGALKGTAETDAAAVAYAVANPTAATDATAGVWAWVRTGFSVTGADGILLRDGSHDSSPVGMGSYSAGSVNRMDHRLMRPRPQ